MLSAFLVNYHGPKSLVRRARRAINAAPLLRHAVTYGLSLTRSPANSSGWIRFLMYHDIRQTERANLARQLRYVAGFGDFISVDAALDLLAEGRAVKGRYFCVTLDDGYKSALTCAVPVFADLGIAAAFFVVPGYISGEKKPHKPVSHTADVPLEFLSWSDCRDMARAGMTIGSHTYSHVRLSELDAAAVRLELSRSKAAIEREIGQPCVHFAAPWGQPWETFQPGRDPEAARDLGYRSFFTTVRGRASPGATSPLAIPRERIEPRWGLYNLRYFLSL
jgi:peptidoglycan/xylan/chitin deacetylase (PgdA/CDA1 family)